MKKYLINSCVVLSAVILFTVHLSAKTKPGNEITIMNKEIIASDKFVFTQIFRNDGTIKGDNFFWCQTITSNGTVEGDVIGGSQIANIGGYIMGNVRTAASSINLSGKVLKNVNAFGAQITIADSSEIGGSLIAMGKELNIGGKIKKNVTLYAKDITLSGEFFGDVTINDHKPERKKAVKKDITARLSVLPGTVIHGKLKYSGDETDIQKGAKIADFEWIKPDASENKILGLGIDNYVKTIVRLIFVSIFYFLTGLLLFKLFPTAFAKMEELKPWSAASHGLIGLLSVIAAVIIFILLMALSYFISPAFGLIFGAVYAGLYMLLILLATIPAAMFVGRLIAKDKINIIYRLALGLIVIKLTIFALSLLVNVPVAGGIFSALEFIIKFVIIVFGAGALIITAKRFLAASRNV